jgi:hypothetical protein
MINVFFTSGLVFSFSTRWDGLDSRLVHVGCVVDEVALEQGFLLSPSVFISLSFHLCYIVIFYSASTNAKCMSYAVDSAYS